LQPSSPDVHGLGQLSQPGAVILGKYRVEHVLGIGGMGAVVAARHLHLDERIAIKVLLPAMLQHEEIVQRFLREARSAIKIRSEHCVRVLDVGTLESGAPYMVMEYLDGQDLASRIERQGPLPIHEAVDLVTQACEALAEAHAIGIIHRDLKPANLFLTKRADGTASVKVLDFGISKQTGVGGVDMGVTKTQAVLGSPRYMSPEQMRSTKDTDARADVWAMGAVLHELIGGHPPFDAETMTALCAMILQDPPRALRPLRPDLPPQLEAAVMGALVKERDRRYANIAQFAAAIAPFGTPSARASAERAARVLGVQANIAQQLPGGSLPFVHGASASGPQPQMMAMQGGSGMAATTSPTVTDATPRKSAGPMVALGVIGAVVVVGAIVLAVGVARRGSHAAGAGTSTTASTLVAAPPASTAPPLTPPGSTAASASATAADASTATVAAGSATTPATTTAPWRGKGAPPPPPRPGAPGAAPAGSPAGPAKPPTGPVDPFSGGRTG
jgi:tRNA A-37 threonylcarbamoyl transferase component Bud32